MKTLLLLCLLLPACAAPVRHLAQAPKQARRHYQHQQRLHQRERARRAYYQGLVNQK